jgi:superfamily II DNA/RNA helicase
MATFSQLQLIEPLQRALAEVDYAEMTPVQAASLPAILSARDVLAQAKTGRSGGPRSQAPRLLHP